MLVRKVRYETALKENDEIRGYWLRAERERDSALVDVQSLHEEVALLKENLNNVARELQTERDTRIDTEYALKTVRKSYGDAEIDGIRITHNAAHGPNHWYFRAGREIVYNENLLYAEVYDGAGRFIAGIHNVVNYEIEYRGLDEDEEE